MKVIVFTLVDGSRVDFEGLTGLRNPINANEEFLKISADAAVEVDDRIKSYEIEEKA